jgi:hypothetical protein
MDTALIPPGVKRCPIWQFVLWIAAAGAVLLWGVFAMLLVYIKGLNQTHMNNAYGFALWIWADLAVIALGGGAFFTGFLRYLVGKDELKNIINFAVLIGFICYSSALLILGFDVGQPLRAWFIFWHANVHSMLTEVAFCLTCYFGVLCIEYLPLILENRQIAKVPFFHNLSHNMHEIMAVFAATGAFLSFFHQGSLGGVGLADDLLFIYLVGGGRRTVFYHLHYQTDGKSGAQKTCQRQCHRAAGKNIRLDALRIYCCQDHRHLVLGFHYGAGRGLYPDGFLLP